MIKQDTKICIIDDNEAVCRALTFLFDSVYNIKPCIYHNPLVFLEEFSSKWNGCLIIDLFIPILNGIDLMKELKKRNNKMPIIIISGHGTGHTAAQAIEAGAHAFIPKPFKIDLFLEKVKSTLQFE